MILHPDYNSPSSLKAFMEEHNLAMQKKFGQNFLVNESARNKLIDALDVKEETVVWEVGPGLGCMTASLLERGAMLTVFEIDHGFARLLPEFFCDYAENGKFTLVEGDVLKTWTGEKEKKGIPERFFGNLPYNVAATIIADTINKGIRFEKCVFTVQKEVAQRMTAKCGSADYSSFSVLCQWAYDIKNLIDLAGGNFWPKPNVSSRAVVFTKKESFPGCDNPELFMKMLRGAFSLRRKTIKNNLLTLFPVDIVDSALNESGIPFNQRSEELPLEKLLLLSDKINFFLK